MGSIIFLLVAGIAVFHILWYGLSLAITRRGLPDEKAIQAFREKEAEGLHINALKGLLEERNLVTPKGRLNLSILPREKGLPTLVFIPGTSVYALIYSEFLLAMHGAGFNVVSFDPRGHGRSSGPRGDYTVSGIVDDALAVTAYAKDRFGGDIVLAGSSQGGIAAFYAAARDDSFKAVICHNLADLNGKDNLILSKLRFPPVFTPLAHALANLYGSFAVPTAVYLDLKREHLTDGRDAASFLKEDPLAVTWITLRALGSLLLTPLSKPVEKITVPVMVVHSDKDHIFPLKYVESITRRLTCKKELLVLKDREHLIFTNHVGEVAPWITAWLKKIMENP
jgi:pimeloyl-ACP methyl ester carboxylesterase